MRRALLLLVAVSLSLIAGGCGSSSSPTASDPLASELSYFPDGSPLVATVATNPQGAAVRNLEALLGAFPLAKLGIIALESQLSSTGVDYQREVQPLWGNPIVFGALQVSSASPLAGSRFLVVWITKSAAKLAALVKGLHGLTGAGTVDGAALYRKGSMAVAVEGTTAVLGSSTAEVAAALNRHLHGGGMSAANFSKAIGNLPRASLVQAVGTLAGTLPASASKVPWVAAIRGYAASLSVTGTGITAQFRLDTSGSSLTTSELPIAAGSTPPSLAGTLPIAVGVHDPAQTIAFLESAVRSADPAGYARFAARDNAARRKSGYDLNTFAALLTGNLMIASDTRTTMGRADVSDTGSAARQLAKLAPFMHAAREPDGFYAIKVAPGKALHLGLVGNQFVAGVATPAQLKAFAAAPTTPVPNAQGSVVFRISLPELLRLALGQAPNPLLGPVLSTLGNITGSASAAPGGLAGQLGLGLK